MIIPYYIFINIVAFLMYGADKYFAKKDMWRISEKALLGIAAIGGAFGAFLGLTSLVRVGSFLLCAAMTLLTAPAMYPVFKAIGGSEIWRE